MEFVRINGARLEVKRIDGVKPAAPTLVFLHEGLGSVSLWRDYPEKVCLLTGHPGFVYSRLGYGRSDPAPLPRPVTFLEEEAERSLPAVLDAAGGDVVLIGHSDGASIALLHATRDEPRVRGLVLMAPHVFVEDISVRSIEKARDAYATTDLRTRLARHHGDNVDVAFRGWNDVWLDPGFRSWNIEARLSSIHVPILLLQGADDEYGTLAQIDAIERGVRGPVTRRVLPSCGHSPQRDQPEETLAATARFVLALDP